MQQINKVLLSVFAGVAVMGIGSTVIMLSGKDDLKYITRFSEEKFKVQDIVGSDLKMAAPNSYMFTVKDGVSVYDKVADSDEYLCSFDDNCGRSKEDTGMFLLHRNNNYLFVMPDLSDKNICYVGEPIWGDVYFPCRFSSSNIYPDGSESAWKEYFEWNRLIGINCFEELVEYYRGTDECLYDVDEADKLIYLRCCYSKAGEPFDAVIKADAAGVTLVHFGESNGSLYSGKYWTEYPDRAAAEI